MSDPVICECGTEFGSNAFCRRCERPHPSIAIVVRPAPGSASPPERAEPAVEVAAMWRERYERCSAMLVDAKNDVVAEARRAAQAEAERDEAREIAEDRGRELNDLEPHAVHIRLLFAQRDDLQRRNTELVEQRRAAEAEVRRLRDGVRRLAEEWGRSADALTAHGIGNMATQAYGESAAALRALVADGEGR